MAKRDPLEVIQEPVAAEPPTSRPLSGPPDGIPERRRYPALGIQHRTAVPRTQEARAGELEAELGG